MHNDYDAHIAQIRQLYKEQAQAMTDYFAILWEETVSLPNTGQVLKRRSIP